MPRNAYKVLNLNGYAIRRGWRLSGETMLPVKKEYDTTALSDRASECMSFMWLHARPNSESYIVSVFGERKLSKMLTDDDATGGHNREQAVAGVGVDKGDGNVGDASIIQQNRGWRFWAIFLALCVTSLLAAVEATVTSTALPTIVHDLDIGDEFLRFSTAFQPLYGQTANIFGRRWLTISAVALFTLGSGLSGGATHGTMLIIGRAIQGVGGGGINMMIDLIVCDLVPLRERGNYLGIIFAVFSVGTSLGPFIGGVIVTNSTWRWVFYINLPIGGMALLLLIAFLHVNYKKDMTLRGRILRIDFIGNAILIASVVAILFATAYGGARFAWSSWRIVVPLVIGFIGLGFYQIYESSRFCVEPTTPPRLFSNRTSATAFLLTFVHALLTVWVIYFLPLYFQAVLGSTAARSGVQLLPTVIVLIPLAAVSGVLVSKTGRYRPLHLAGFALMTVGFGLFTLLNSGSSTAVWVIFQIFAAAGSGLVVPALLPAAQAELPESDTATATATWAFVRSFGAIWGISIPAAIFNNQFDNLLYRISDAPLRGLLSGGQAYSRASRDFINSFPTGLRQELIGVYSDSLKLVWQVGIAFSGLSFLLVFLEKEIKLRTTLETEFGLKNGGKSTVASAGNGHGEDESKSVAKAEP
ncbi:MAG: hypothetical protein Q9217_001177 [Psora testacea]